MYVPAFSMKQRITMMANKYELIAANPDGTDGPLIAFAQQKRMAFKEQVTFYADDSKTQVVFSFKARKKIDLGSGYDVFDANGQPIGWFKKEFGKSLLRSSWQLAGGGVEADGTERLCAEAEGLFISMDFGRFAAMKEQREQQERDRLSGTDAG